MLAHRPDLRVESIRGNVQTRLSKLDSGEFDAIVLAQAGLSRLGIDRGDAHPLAVEDCLPAPGQGALGIEILSNSPVEAFLEKLHNKDVARCVEAERGISAGLGADCALPVAAYATADVKGVIHMRALVAQPDGRAILRAEGHGSDPSALAHRLVAELLDHGAQSILDSARRG